MRNIIQILLSMSLILLFSCSASVKDHNRLISPINNNENLSIIDIDKAVEENKILYSSLFKPPKSIILETNENCLIKSEGGLQVYKNRIYILDKDNKNLFVFDMNGVFVQKIGSVGSGPGEFYDISDFTIDIQNNVIYLLDDYTNIVNKYDATSGEFIEKIKIEANNEQASIIQYISGYLYTNSLPMNGNLEKHLLMKINAVNGKQEAIYLDAAKYNKGSNLQLRNTSSFFYSRNSHSPKYVEMFMDTIISISKEEIVPIFAIKSKYFVTNNDLEEIHKTYMQKGVHDFSPIYEKGKIFNINNYIEFDNFVCFQFEKGNDRFYLLYNTSTQEVKITKFLMNDFIMSENRIPMDLCFSDEKGIYALLRQDFIPYFVDVINSGQINPSVDQYEKILKIQEDSNPIIFYHEYTE